MAAAFRWSDFNIGHAQKHGCTIAEIESVGRRPTHGYPRNSGNGKYLIVGRGQGGRLIEVIFLRDSGGTIYVIHAQPISTRRKRRR